MSSSAVAFSTGASSISVVSSNTSIYVSPNGSDTVNTGSSSSPFKTLGHALETLKNKRISPGVTVTIFVTGAVSFNGANERHTFSATTFEHPDGERIVISGEKATPVTIQSISSYNANSATTGGYYMEAHLNASSGITVGDFIFIHEPNYRESSKPAGGPIIYEVDFENERMAVRSAEHSGNAGQTYDNWIATSRKTLATGPHQVVATNGLLSATPTVLLFVRHDNPWEDTRTSTDDRSAFVTPQGIVLSASGIFNTNGSLINTYSSPILGNISSGTLGLTGAADTEFGGVSGETFFTSIDRRHVNLSANVLKTRLNFDSTDGLKILSSIGRIEDIVLCGPAHAGSAGGTYAPESNTKTGIYIAPNVNCVLKNVGISGFDKGIYIDHGSMTADQVFASGNNYNVFCDSGRAYLNESIVTGSGNSSIYGTNNSSLVVKNTIIAANKSNGVELHNGSVAEMNYCNVSLNGTNGILSNGSIVELSGTTSAYGATSDASLGIYSFGTNGYNGRFFVQSRDGNWLFHNKQAGIRLDQNSTLNLSGSVVSYNGESGVLSIGSQINAFRSNVWANGGSLGAAITGITQSSIASVYDGTVRLENTSVGNSVRGIYLNGSYMSDSAGQIVGNTNEGLYAEMKSLVRLLDTGVTGNSTDISANYLTTVFLDNGANTVNPNTTTGTTSDIIVAESIA
jgi:hypothetical protein